MPFSCSAHATNTNLASHDRTLRFYETKYRRSNGRTDSTNMSTNFLGHLGEWIQELSNRLGGGLSRALQVG